MGGDGNLRSGVPMELPETAQLGASAASPCMRAIQQVMLAQAAFWALTRSHMGPKTEIGYNGVSSGHRAAGMPTCQVVLPGTA